LHFFLVHGWAIVNVEGQGQTPNHKEIDMSTIFAQAPTATAHVGHDDQAVWGLVVGLVVSVFLWAAIAEAVLLAL
jgi:hypothetical protein